MASSIGITLEIDGQQYRAELQKATQATKDFGNAATNEGKRVSDSLDKVDKKSNQLASGLSRLKSVLAGAAFIGFARSALALADSIDDLKNATGLTTQEIINFQQALQFAGGNADQAGKAIIFFFEKVDEAAQGSAKAQEAFGRLGIGLDKLAKLSEQELLVEVAQRLKEMPAGAERTALQAELLGKAFKGVTIDDKFLQTLAEGGPEAEKLAKEIERAAAMNEAFEKTWYNLRLAFIEAFGPILEGIAKLLKQMPELITAMKVLGVVIVTTFAASGIKTFVTLLGSIAGLATRAAGAIKNLWQGKKAVEAGKGGALAADVVVGAGTAVAAVGAATALFSGEEEYKKATDNAAKSGNEQQKAVRKVVDALRSQKEAILSVSAAYEESTAKVIQRIQDEAKMVNMTDKQKEALRTRTQVEQEAASQIARLNEMRLKSDGKLTEQINKEIRKIEERRDLVISQLDVEIAKKYEALRIDELRVKSMEAMYDIQNKVKDIQDGYLLDTLTGIEKQLKQIEIQERRVRDAAIQRFEIENRNLPPDEFATRRAAEYARLNAVFEETVKKQQEAAKEGYAQSRTFENGWTKAFKEYVDNATNAAQAAQRVFQKATQGMEDLIINFAKTGKFQFKDFMNSILEELLRSQVRSLMAQIFNLQGKSVSAGGGLLGGSIIPGFLAQGGSAKGGMPYVVGENGPELFVPSGDGTVVPNNQLAAAATYVTYNINAVDARSFKEMVAADPAFIYAVSQQGSKTIPQTRR